MFVRETEPVMLSEPGLLCLCASLNRPIVDFEALPLGPARAAIALHRDASGATRLAVAFRSIESGVVCVFTHCGEPHSSIDQALDQGLSFAESMGFLFDDDMIVGSSDGSAGLAAIDHAAGTQRERGAAHAHAFWCELIGEERSVVPAVAAASPVVDRSRAAVSSDVVLSKFRNTMPSAALSNPTAARSNPTAARSNSTPGLASAESSADTSPATLGRIPIVKRRLRDDTPTSPDFTTRLLACF